MDDNFFLDKRDRDGLREILRDWRARFPWLRPLNRRRGGGAGGGTTIRRAQIAEVPTNTNHVKASLLNASTGIAVTEGYGFEITVYGRICGGERLDRVSPKISIGDIFSVQQNNYDNDGTPEKRWYFVQNFHAAAEYI